MCYHGVMKDKSVIVRWRDGLMPRASTVEALVPLFEDYGHQGMTTAEIARMMGTGRAGVARVLRNYPLIRDAYQRGIDGRSVDVEAALLKRSLGFSVPNGRVVTKKVDGEVVEEVVTQEEVYYPPDVAAIKLMLTNRAKGRYNREDDGKPAVTIVFGEAEKGL